MRNNRQTLILNLIKEKDIETQDELAEELRKLNVNVTQATISRDIKSLRLIKSMTKNGKYKYATSENDNYALSDKLIRIFAESVLSIDSSNNIIVLKTRFGSAKVASEAVDSMHWPEILGTVAGDNTIVLVIRNEEEVPQVIEKLNHLKQQ